MERLNTNIVLATFAIAFGLSFELGYNIGVLNQVETHIKDFFSDTYSRRNNGFVISDETLVVLWSFTTAIFVLGGLFGAFIGGELVDRIGRKGGVFVAHEFIVMGVVTSVSCQTAGSPELLMLGRLMFGVNAGLVGCLTPTILSEISTTKHRGSLITMHQLFITIGVLVASVFGIPPLLGTRHGWPFLFLVEIIPVAVSSTMLLFLPETPTYLLLLRNQPELARRSLQFYRKSANVDDELERARSEGTDGRVTDSCDYSMRHLFTARYRRTTFAACMLQVMQQWSGFNSVSYYSMSIFKNAGVPNSDIPYLVLLPNVVLVLMTLLALPVIDRVSRRRLLILPMLAMIVDLALLTVALCLQPVYPSIANLGIVCIIGYVVCFSVGLGPLPGLMGTELFPRGSRPKAMSLVMLVNLVCAFVFLATFPSLERHLGGYTFLVFIFLLGCFSVFAYCYVPETKHRSFEQIACREIVDSTSDMNRGMSDINDMNNYSDQVLVNSDTNKIGIDLEICKE